MLSRTGRVTSFEFKRIGQGKGFAGQIARVRLRYDAPEPNAPATLIAKFATEHAPTREMLGEIDGYVREVRFYRELARDIGIGTPHCYFAHYDSDDGRFCLLLEDLAPARSADRDVGLNRRAGEARARAARRHARALVESRRSDRLARGHPRSRCAASATASSHHCRASSSATRRNIPG